MFVKEPTNLSYLVASPCPLALAFWMSTICEVTQGCLTTCQLPGPSEGHLYLLRHGCSLWTLPKA